MSFDSQISNFYEKLVVDELHTQREAIKFDDEALIDIACVALNQLPSRYYRYSVDMAFYLSAGEFSKMKEEVQAAVTYAIDFVTNHRNQRDGH